MSDTSAPVENAEPTADPKELARRWKGELRAAEEQAKPFWERAEKIVKRFVDDRKDDKGARDTQRLNLFTANTQTMEALLFGKTPEAAVDRLYADSEDDVARVAGEILERLVNGSMDDAEQEALRNALKDRLLPGFGSVKLRYEIGETVLGKETPAQIDPTTGAELAPAVPAQEKRPNEKVPVDYVYWKDELWSPCRTYSDLRWRGWRSALSKPDFEKRFGKELTDAAWTANTKTPEAGDDDTKVKDHLQRCDVFEIWSKDDKHVYWLADGYPDLLDDQPDPLELKDFWPAPRPMFANLTTSKLMPTPDFALAQDLYDEIDDMSTRVMLLEQCLKVRGVYDKNNEEIKRLISETGGNELIAVDGWAAFAEKGGVKGAIDWLPLEMIATTIDTLNAQIDRKIAQLFQITGMSDIMRGQASEQTTATEQAIKARFASVRVQTLQDEFARFASDTQRLKAEIISKQFDPATIIDRSNIQRTPDAALAQQAIQLIKSDFYQWRISVNPDSVSLTDFAALKAERFEFAQAISGYFQSMIPFVQMLGASAPGAGAAAVKFVIGLAQTMVAGLKGAQEMEGIFDQFVAALEKAAQTPPPPPQPDPKLEAAKVKAGAEQVKAKADVVKTGLDLQVAQQEHTMDMQRMQAEQQHAGVMAGIKSQEAQARAQAVNAVDGVASRGPT